MANIVDISAKITNERPFVKIAEGKEYEVDNRKNTILAVYRLMDNMDQMSAIDEALKHMLGKAAFAEIDKMELGIADYQKVFIAVFAAATEEEYDTVEARFRKTNT